MSGALQILDRLNVTKTETLDPGTGKAIGVKFWNQTFVFVIAASATETNTLARPNGPNQRVRMLARTVGSGGTRTVTITTSTGTSTLIFAAAGDYVVLESVTVGAGTYDWKVARATGATGTATNLSTYQSPLKLRSFHVWDAPQTNPVGTAANDDLALIYNTFGTAATSVESGDGKATTITRKIGFEFEVPDNYVAGQNLTLRLNAGMKTTVSDGTATIDAEVTRRAAATVDICATAATTINSLTAADKDFTLTGTNVVPGDILDVVLTIAITDTATGTAVIGKLYLAGSGLRMPIRG